MILKRLALHILFMYFLLNTSVSLAAYPGTREDFSLLPPFCIAQLKPEWSPPGAPKLWSSRLPGGYAHLHHYCAALHSLRLALSIPGNNVEERQAKQTLLRSVIGDVQYMEDKSDPNFILRPNMYATKAEALFVLERPTEAAAYLTKAMERNKRFTKAYSMLADYYIKTGNTKSATEILQEGLKFSPRSKKLQKRLNALSKETATPPKEMAAPSKETTLPPKETSAPAKETATSLPHQNP